jgi:hypothetical protein
MTKAKTKEEIKKEVEDLKKRLEAERQKRIENELVKK